jgi:Domain of unknown function (DUF6249)
MTIDMGHSLGDALIVVAVAGVFVAYLYFRHVERRRRLEIVHQERLAAMEKGIPLPELPLEPAGMRKPPDPRAPLLHGIVWAALGFGAMAALVMMRAVPNGLAPFWPLPLPLLFLGVGLMLYYALASNRTR